MFRGFWNKKHRSFSAIPKAIIVLFALGLCLQFSLPFYTPSSQAIKQELPSIPDENIWPLISFGEAETLSKLLMLWLQAFDNQPGISIPFNKLDYQKLQDWLNIIIKLDPKSNYPMLVASRIYTEVPNHDKQEKMMNFVYQQFLLDPKKNWPWLAHVTMLAKHRLNNHTLALKYANALADSKFNYEIPSWARQLNIIVLEDIGELETARLLIGGLIESKTITDPKELFWLEQRLKQLETGN